MRARVAATMVAAALLGPASAHAALGTNVVVDGGGEGITAQPTDQRVPPAWTARNGFSVRPYGAAGGWPDTADRDAVGGGANFFEGGARRLRAASQIIDLSRPTPQAIAGGQVQGDAVRPPRRLLDRRRLRDRQRRVARRGPATTSGRRS